jgi:hypothetical protein
MKSLILYNFNDYLFRKELRNATVSSLDTCDVKRKCRLSLNLAREAKCNQGNEFLSLKNQENHYQVTLLRVCGRECLRITLSL